LAQTAPIWNSVEIVYNTRFTFTPGESEHKFGAYYRKCIVDGKFTRETKITLFSGDADLVNLSLLFHNRNIPIMRDKTEVVSVAELRTLMAAAHGARERRIDDVSALSFFTGNDFRVRTHRKCLPAGVRDSGGLFGAGRQLQPAVSQRASRKDGFGPREDS
jgi:5'-3' exonuclease